MRVDMEVICVKTCQGTCISQENVKHMNPPSEGEMFTVIDIDIDEHGLWLCLSGVETDTTGGEPYWPSGNFRPLQEIEEEYENQDTISKQC